MVQENSRRSFMKKVAYTAPAVMALGGLTLPTDASALVKPSNLVWVKSKLNDNNKWVSVWKDPTSGDKWKFVYSDNTKTNLIKTVAVDKDSDD